MARSLLRWRVNRAGCREAAASGTCQILLARPRFVQLAEATMADEAAGYADQVPFAFLAEEHAWLKTAGYADLSSRLVPYNGRVKEYPRHVPDDRLPLPELTQAPEIDGVRSEAAWGAASQGTAWAAYPYDRARSPLMDHQVEAGIHEGSLYLALTLTPIASGHLAVVSLGRLGKAAFW